jgi:hypothetical protein
MIRLRLRASNAFESWGIARLLRTPGAYSHVDIVLPDGRLLGAHIVPGVDADGEPVKSGVAIREPDYGPVVRTMDLLYPASSVKTRHFHVEAYRQTGKPFDWTALVYFLSPYRVRRRWQETEGYFCSELVADLFKTCEVHGLNSDFDQESITPRDLLVPDAAKWEAPVEYPQNAGFWCK